jgi:hypothetical protein
VRRARSVSLSVGAYLRTKAFGSKLDPGRIPAANLRFLSELSRLGNNLNQLLVLIYTGRAPLGLLATLRALRREVGQLRAELAGVSYREEPEE